MKTEYAAYTALCAAAEHRAAWAKVFNVPPTPKRNKGFWAWVKGLLS